MVLTNSRACSFSSLALHSLCLVVSISTVSCLLSTFAVILAPTVAAVFPVQLPFIDSTVAAVRVVAVLKQLLFVDSSFCCWQPPVLWLYLFCVDALLLL